MSNNDYIIDIKNVTKKYGTNIVLNDVTVSFEKGKIHGLVGRNGSGKTMLMKCICGFVTPSSGEILINGIKVDRNSKALDNIGAIIENPGFLGNYSAYNNLKFLAAINKKAGKDKIRETIKLVGLDPDNKKHVDSALRQYNENNENWRVNVNIANYSIKALSLYAMKKNADFSDSWDELMEVTNFKSLYRISEIASFINGLTY
jgi:ABC-type sugar transport system ATPase subunit